MYYAQFDNQGNRLASYHTDVHTNIPLDAIKISDEDQALYATNEYIRGANGKPQKKPSYVPTIDELKTEKWERIKAERDQREQAGAPYMGSTLDSDTLSVQRIAIAVQAAQAAVSAGTDFNLDWTMQDNSVITMTAAQVIGMSIALAQYSNHLHHKARALKQQIEAAVTVEEVQAVQWSDT